MTDQAPTGSPFSEILNRLADGETLSAADAGAAFDQIMAGAVDPIQTSSVLTAIRIRGATPHEIAGGVEAMRRAMIPVESPDAEYLVDTAGTGGGLVTTFNISTAAAIVAAAAGVPMAKHGNRSFSSRSGSADVLEALGVRIDLTPDAMARVLEDVGIVFMFAPILHPAMRHVGPVRRSLGFRTLMNLLGPLANPAGAQRQVVGVSDPEFLHLIVHALKELGHFRALVVHGEPGMDEVSPMGRTRVAELRDGGIHEYDISPEEFGFAVATADELAGGEPEENAALVRAVLSGERIDGARSAVLLNAGAAIYVGGRAESLRQGVRVAAEAVDSGAALQTLERLRDASVSAAESTAAEPGPTQS
jgi:anthranilate phosphoribosyltransferase